MTLLSNPNDYRGFNTPTFEPKETFIDKELDVRLDKMKSIKGDITKVMQEIIMTCMLLGAQGRTISREHLRDLIPRIMEEAEINAASYNNKVVWGLAIAGALATVLGGAYASYGISTAIANNSTKVAYNMIQGISSTQQIFSGAGQGMNTASSLISQRDEGQRNLRNHIIQYWTTLRDQGYQNANSADGKTSEAERALREIINALHSIAGEVLRPS